MNRPETRPHRYSAPRFIGASATFFALAICVAACLAAGCGGIIINPPSTTSCKDCCIEASGRYMQGIARQRAGDLKGALEEFAEAYRLDPGSATVAARLGIVLHRLGRREEAMPYLAAGERAATEERHLALVLARFYADIGQESDALRMSEIAAAAPQYKHEALWVRAKVLYKQGEMENAGKIAAALARKRGDAKDWLLLGRILEAQAKTGEAAAAFLHAADLRPEAAMRASQLYAQQGNYAQAAGIIRRFLSVIPPQAELGGISLELPPSPRSDVKPWVWRPEYTARSIQRSAYVHIAWIALSRKSHAAAEAALVESLGETGDYYQACEFLGDIKRDTGQNDSALKHYRKALSLTPPQAARSRIEEKIAASKIRLARDAPPALALGPVLFTAPTGR